MSDRVYHNQNMLLQKGIQKVMTLITDALKGISKSAAKELAQEFESAWREMAASKLSGRGKDAQRYLDGIQGVQVGDGRISLRLSGHEAQMVEQGWAPPSQMGASPEDGLGTYDGKKHDMRPFLLYGSDKWDGVAGHGPSLSKKGYAYKVVKLPAGGTESGITDSVRDYLQARTDKSRLQPGMEHISKKTAGALQADFEAGMGQLLADARSNKRNKKLTRVRSVATTRLEGGRVVPTGESREAGGLAKPGSLAGEATAGIPLSSTILWTETMGKSKGRKGPRGDHSEEIKHRNFIYKGLRAEHKGGSSKKFSFHLLRTISSDPKQGNQWFATGVAPAYLLQDKNGESGPVIYKIIEVLLSRGIEMALKKVPRRVTV